MGKISSIDINFGGNGSAHTATVTTVEGIVRKPNGGSRVTIGDYDAGFGDNSPAIISSDYDTTNLSNILGNFVVDEITTTTDARKTIKKFKLIDEVSQVIDRYVVLVRGQQVAPYFQSRPDNEGIFFRDYVFDCSELPDGAKDVVQNPLGDNNQIVRGDTNVEVLNGNVIVIGRTRSVFNPNLSDGSNLDAQKQRVSAIYEGGSIKRDVSIGLGTNQSPSNDYIKSQIDNVTLQYGYTIQDFIDIFDNLEISVNGLESDYASLVFLDYSGTLRSVISSIASLLGLYWYIDLDKSSIEFVNAEDIDRINQHKVQVGTGNDILNTSITERGYSPSLVLSFNGSTDAKINKSQNTVTIRNDGVHFQQTNFFRVKVESLINVPQNDPPKFFSRIMMSYYYKLFTNYKVNKDEFNAYTYALHFAKEDLNEGKLNQFDFGNAFLPNLKTTSQQYSIDEFYEEFARDKRALVKKDISDYDSSNLLAHRLEPADLQSENNNKVGDPDRQGLRTYFEKIFKILGSIYISQPYSLAQIKDRVIESPNLNIQGPFLGSTKLVDIQEVSAIADLVQCMKTMGINVKSLDIAAIMSNPDYSKYPSTDLDRSQIKQQYFYIGTRSFSNEVNFGVDNNFNPSAARKEINRAAFLYKDDKKQYVIYDAKRLIDLMNSSISEFEAFVQKGIKTTTVVVSQEQDFEPENEIFYDRIIGFFKSPRSKTEDDTPTQSGNNDSDVPAPDMKFNDVLHRVYYVEPSENQKLRGKGGTNKTELRQYSGSVGDMAILSENISVAKPIKMKTATTTYYGLNLPESTDASLDSISIRLGEGGLETTVTRSTKAILSPDTTLIIQDGKQAAITNNGLAALSASQKNFFKI